jgi:hypothetical protein
MACWKKVTVKVAPKKKLAGWMPLRKGDKPKKALV